MKWLIVFTLLSVNICAFRDCGWEEYSSQFEAESEPEEGAPEEAEVITIDVGPPQNDFETIICDYDSQDRLVCKPY